MWYLITTFKKRQHERMYRVLRYEFHWKTTEDQWNIKKFKQMQHNEIYGVRLVITDKKNANSNKENMDKYIK